MSYNTFILAVSRSGSGTLTRAYSSTFDLTPIREPFNSGPQFDLLPKVLKQAREVFIKDRILPEKWVVKSIVDQITMQEAINLHSKADYTILLGRKNVTDRLVALNHAIKHLGTDWHQPYSNPDTNILPSVYDIVDRQEVCIKMFSQALKVPITFYEDLFYDKDFKESFIRNLGKKQDLFLSYLNPENRYRKDKTIL